MTEARTRFVKLAENRVNKAIKMIRLIGNLSNKSNYSYTETDVQNMFGVLEKELKAAKAKFSMSKHSPKDKPFSLPQQ